MEDSRVCIVVLNEDHEVVLAQRDNNQYDLDDGETADFSVTLVVPDDTEDVTHVRVLVDAINADEDDRPTEPQVVTKVDVSTATPTPTATPTNTSTATPTPTQTSTSTPTATNTP
jgi:hypothetical protein